MRRNERHAWTTGGLLFLVCQSCCSNQPPTGAVEKPSGSATLVQEATRAKPDDDCVRPDIEFGSPAKVTVLGSSPVELSFSFLPPKGRDGAALEQHLGLLANQTFTANEVDWRRCQTSSALGGACPAWKIDTECKSASAGKVLSVICVNRLSDSPEVRPSLSYSALNVVRCGGSLRVLDFEKDVCPSWDCLDGLHAALVDNGLRERPLGLESSRLTVKKIAQRFFLAEEQIVFLLGNLALDNMDFDKRFVVGYNVIAISYGDLLKVAPDAQPLLRSVDLAPR